MKKIKVLILLIAIILISGCSGTYNLTIDKDLSVEEKMNIVLEGKAEDYDKVVSLFTSNNIDSEKYKIITEEDNLNIEYKDVYNSVEEYLLNSFLYKQLFDSISFNTDRKQFSLEASNIFNNTSGKLNYSNKINKLKINVITPFEVIDNNADSIKDNKYTWVIDNNTKEKDAYIVFNVKGKILSFGTILIICSFALVIIILISMLIKKMFNSRKI
ncbi:MAG: hypothetical protein IKE10_03010 [Bacilli bacterium]|nr:hypothetical protein [Bacilli bacterium]